MITIRISGPAASGKSFIARIIAKALEDSRIDIGRFKIIETNVNELLKETE